MRFQSAYDFDERGQEVWRMRRVIELIRVLEERLLEQLLSMHGFLVY